MSQQLPPATQLGPFSGGEIVTGLRLVSTFVGAIVSVIVAGINGGCGCGTVRPMVWVMSVGRPEALSTATSSHTSPVCDGPSFVVGVEPPSTRVQYASPSPDRESKVLSPATAASDVSVTSCCSVLVSSSS